LDSQSEESPLAAATGPVLDPDERRELRLHHRHRPLRPLRHRHARSVVIRLASADCTNGSSITGLTVATNRSVSAS
jgi:hypothetical protein